MVAGSALPYLTQRAWLAAAAPKERAFARALGTPRKAQQRVLHEVLSSVCGSDQAACLDTKRLLKAPGEAQVRLFQERVPLTRYEHLEDRIDAIRRGQNNALTGERVTRLVPTSGSTGRPKLIPYTRTLKRQMNRAIAAWVVDLYRNQPSLMHGPAYWSVSPGFDVQIESAVPVGFEGDSAYLGGLLGTLVERCLAAPEGLRHVRPMEAFQYASLLFLLREEKLRLLSIWHPSFFELILEGREQQHFDRVTCDIARGTFSFPCEGVLPEAVRRRLRPNPQRAKMLKRLGPNAAPECYWPRLAHASAWGDAAARPAFAKLQRTLHHAKVVPKGLLSTEAFSTFPYRGVTPLAVTSHFFEFLDDVGKAGCLMNSLSETSTNWW